MIERQNVKPTAIETEHIKELEVIANQGLRAAHAVYDDLGVSGKELIAKNQFGDTALKVDIEAERAVLDVLRSHNVSMRVVSEEHGETIIGRDSNPQYLGILDGLDGSYIYRKQQGKGRYGTMFGIYTNTDPFYADYIYGGVMEHAADRLYVGVRGKGSYVMVNGKMRPIHVSLADALDVGTTMLYADTYYDQLYGSDAITSRVRKLTTRGFVIPCLRSSAIHYADLAQGNVDGVIENTRKGNLEIAVAYPLVIEAGGVMVDLKGNSLKTQRYHKFGQLENVPVVSAATTKLARQIVTKLG